MESSEKEKTRDFFTGQDFSKGFNLKMFLEYNYGKNRFYPYGKFDKISTKEYADGLFKEDMEFADQEGMQIINWVLHHGHSYEGACGNGKRSSWTEFSLEVNYVLNGTFSGRMFHFRSSEIITEDK